MTKIAAPIQYGIRNPTSISVELAGIGFDRGEIILSFGAGQDRLTIVLTERQWQELILMAGRPKEPVGEARKLYEEDAISLERFEEILDRQMRR